MRTLVTFLVLAVSAFAQTVGTSVKVDQIQKATGTVPAQQPAITLLGFVAGKGLVAVQIGDNHKVTLTNTGGVWTARLDATAPAATPVTESEEAAVRQADGTYIVASGKQIVRVHRNGIRQAAGQDFTWDITGSVYRIVPLSAARPWEADDYILCDVRN